VVTQSKTCWKSTNFYRQDNLETEEWSAVKEQPADFTTSNSSSPTTRKEMSQQDASAPITERVPLSNAQEPQDDAPENADNLSAKDAGSAITKDVLTTIRLYFHNPVYFTL
jgi:hypothetical protein